MMGDSDLDAGRADYGSRVRDGAAVLTLLVAVVVAIVPFAVLSGALAREAMGVYDRVQSGQWNPGLYFHQIFDAMPAWVRDELDRFGLIDFDTLQRRLTAAVAQASQFIAARALGVGQDTFAFIVDLFITVYVAFFLIRDGASLVRALRRAIPLSAEHKKDLFDKFATVIRATVKGNPQGAEGKAQVPAGSEDATRQSAEECPGECIFIEE